MIGIATGNVANVDVLQPIIEGKPVGYELQDSESTTPSFFSQLPLVIIFQVSLGVCYPSLFPGLIDSYPVWSSCPSQHGA
jgi:hypothetical protein